MTWLVFLFGVVAVLWFLFLLAVLALCRMAALSDIDQLSDHEFFERVDDNGDLH